MDRQQRLDDQISLGYTSDHPQRLDWSKVLTTSHPLRLERTDAFATSESELSITKRQLTATTHDLLEQRLTSERHLMEANSANASLQSQLKEALSKLDVSQRQRASLLAKERELTERDLHAKEELETQRNDLKKELREARNALGKIQEDKSSLGEILREVKHSERQALAGLKEQSFLAEELEKELGVEREGREAKEAELREEREKSRSRETVIERLEGELKGQENVAVVKEELHRPSFLAQSTICTKFVMRDRTSFASPLAGEGEPETDARSRNVQDSKEQHRSPQGSQEDSRKQVASQYRPNLLVPLDVDVAIGNGRASTAECDFGSGGRSVPTRETRMVSRWPLAVSHES